MKRPEHRLGTSAPSAVRRWLALNVNELTWIALVAGGVSLAGLMG